MKLTGIYKALISLTIAVSTGSAAAAPQAFDGSLTIVADFDREHGDVAISGPAAYALFGLIIFRTRLEYISDSLRRVRSRDAVCYEHGGAELAPEDWYYTCQLTVGEYGEISAPPL